MKRLVTMTIALAMALTINAQPSAVKKAAKSLITINTYDAEGNAKATVQGIFTSSDGEAITAWEPFVGAERATATDANGKTYNIEAIAGINEIYDVCKIRISAKSNPVAFADIPSTAGEEAWMISSAGDKAVYNVLPTEKVETFMEKYNYYIFTCNGNESKMDGCPIVNAKGQLIGLTHIAGNNEAIHGVDASFVKSLAVNGMSVSEPISKKTGIRLQLPDDKSDAMVMLVMARQHADSAKYAGYVDNYITMFPEEVDGYSIRAFLRLGEGNFAEADRDMLTAIDKATDKAEAHSEYSRLMYQKLVYDPDTTFTLWNLDMALNETKKAYEIDPKPVYKHREGQIIFSQQHYNEAYEIFMGLTDKDLNREELYFEAAQCKTQLGAPDTEIIVLLDSAVASCGKPLTAMDAPYYLARGQMHDKMGEYRRALLDYNVYDTLTAGRADASFYYARYLCELNLKQYQQALNDIAHAAVLSPMEPIYLAEMASLQLRVNHVDDAIMAADICIKIAPEMTDAYIIKGIALATKQDYVRALECLQKASELGDERAQPLIEKYSAETGGTSK